jgi:hypothetical protein
MKKNDPLPAAVRAFLSTIGKRGGQSTSERKKIAAAANGLKGGRPRKAFAA